jgi:organic radical activating enzyme
MTFESFQKIIQNASENPRFRHQICISGGEPSVHPDMTKMIQAGLDTKSNVILKTNGAWVLTDKSNRTWNNLERLNFINGQRLGIDISVDKYHDNGLIIANHVLKQAHNSEIIKNNSMLHFISVGPDREVIQKIFSAENIKAIGLELETPFEINMNEQITLQNCRISDMDVKISYGSKIVMEGNALKNGIGEKNDVNQVTSVLSPVSKTPSLAYRPEGIVTIQSAHNPIFTTPYVKSDGHMKTIDETFEELGDQLFEENKKLFLSDNPSIEEEIPEFVKEITRTSINSYMSYFNKNYERYVQFSK